MTKSYKHNYKQETQSHSHIKVFAIFLVLTVALLSFTGVVLATTTDFNNGENPSGYIEDGITIKPSKYPYNPNITSLDDEPVLTSAAKDLPSKYDLRTYNRTQPLRNQKPYGTCWAFATIASIESDLLTKDYDTYNGVDLSELHLAYFANNREEISNIDNPLPGLEGLKGDFTYTYPQTNYLDNGGNAYISMYTLMSWIGAVNENTVRYNNDMYNDLEKGLALYSDDFHVQNVTMVSLDNSDAVKQMLMEKGAAVFNMNLEESTKYIKPISKNTVSYYRSSDVTSINHVVTLIGWDDNFSDFNTPPTDKGAWLLQNSWGEEAEAYIWLSYYDSVLRVDEADEVAFFEVSSASEYDNNYQYDGAAWIKYYENQGAVDVANVFQANSDEILKAVAIATMQPDIFYSVQIYKNPTSDNPKTGTPLLQSPMTGFIQYTGYHTIPLSEDIELSKGDKFSIVVNLSSESNKVMVAIEMNVKEGELYVSNPHAELGQSYIYYNNAWTDIKAAKEFEKCGNLRIKAYTKDVVPKNVFAGGDGSANYPYLIETDTQLNYVRYGLDKHYMLIDDIDLSNYSDDEGWLPIGTFEVNQFYGVFDGNGHKIKNLFINRPYDDGVGLFGNATNAIITDLTLENVNITGRNYVGGLVGHNFVGTSEPYIDSYGGTLDQYGGTSMIMNCHVSGDVSGSSMIGGIIGSNNVSSTHKKSISYISGISFSGNASGFTDVGGIIGANNLEGLGCANIMSCSASGVVKGIDSNVRVSSNVGGLIGLNNCTGDGKCEISVNYATADVLGNESVGGIIGCNNQSDNGEISVISCYSAGCVNGGDFVGGLVGSNILNDESNLDDESNLNEESDVGRIAIRDCVALNPVVISKKENINRIVGVNNGGELENNYAINSMVNNANRVFIDEVPAEYGENLDPKEAESEEFYKKKVTWFFQLVWKMLDSDVSTYRYPVFKTDTDAPISPTPITELPTISGRYILNSDIEIDSTWNAPQGFVSIDLNGHTISLKSGEIGSVINVGKEAILSIQDSSDSKSGAITGGNAGVGGNTDGNGGGVYISDGVLVMLGGSISNNSANCGGGVYVEVDANDYEEDDDDVWISPTWWHNFAFFGGNITNNTAKQDGGGVYASGYSEFLLSGGSIDNNVAENRGGGACINTSGFYLSEGEITGNIAKSGGGVATVGCHLIIVHNGVIKGNKAVCGGGLDIGSDLRISDPEENHYEDNSQTEDFNSLIILNCTIIENEAEIGGGIYLYNGTEITCFNGIIKDNIARKQSDSDYGESYDGVQSNVYICSNSSLEIVCYDISHTCCIGVTTEVEPTAGNPIEFGYITYYEDEDSLPDGLASQTDCTRCFISDDSSYHVENKDNVLYLAKTIPVVPDLPTPTKDESGNVTILVDESKTNATIDDMDNRKVTIQDKTSGVNMTIIFNEPQSNPSEIKGTVDEGNIFTQYNERDAIFANGAATTKYQLNITLKDVTNLLPTISPEIIPEVEREVINSGMELAVMISATTNVSEINNNITKGGLAITFTVPESWYKSMKGGVFSIHMKDGVLTKTPVTGDADDKGNVIITVKGDSFSSYGVVGLLTPVQPTPTPTPSSGGTSGSSTWLTPTETGTPTETPTVTPTSPTDIQPTTQPTSTTPAKTPVSLVGLLASICVSLVVAGIRRHR